MKRTMKRMARMLCMMIGWMNDRRARAERKEHEDMMYAARKRISVMAWRDDLWLTVDGLPVIRTSDMSHYLVDMVTSARENVACYLDEVRRKDDV